MVEFVPQERAQQRIVEHAPPPRLEETIEAKWAPQERVLQLTVEHAPVPLIHEETAQVVKLVSLERVQQRSGERIEVVPKCQERPSSW